MPSAGQKASIFRSFSIVPLEDDDASCPNLYIMKHIPENAESAIVLVGALEFLGRACVGFVRLAEGHTLGSLVEVPLPCRFVVVLLVPRKSSLHYYEMGRSMGTLLSNKVSQSPPACSANITV